MKIYDTSFREFYARQFPDLVESNQRTEQMKDLVSAVDGLIEPRDDKSMGHETFVTLNPRGAGTTTSLILAFIFTGYVRRMPVSFSLPHERFLCPTKAQIERLLGRLGITGRVYSTPLHRSLATLPYDMDASLFIVDAHIAALGENIAALKMFFTK